jgi:two-component system, NarL family, response regulator NreC
MAAIGVLIADDNDIVRYTLSRLFKAAPEFEVLGEAGTGQEAVVKAEQLRPDLVILDLSMPVLNGLEAAHILRQKLPDLRLILYTAHDGDVVEGTAVAAGFNAVIPKSKTPASVLTEARLLLNKSGLSKLA